MLDEPSLGYSFDPPCVASHPGYKQLSVWLRTAPTERHYDPERARLPVASNHTIEMVTVRHPAFPPFNLRVCIGRIHLTDRLGKHVDAFTFGGEAHTSTAPDVTTLIIQSPAPIYALLPTNTLSGEFVDAVESVLAEQHAQWDMRFAARGPTFEERLAILSPLTLYCACLLAIEDKLRPLMHRPYAPAQHLEHFILHERRELEAEGRWLHHPASFTELLWQEGVS